jgi:hypothetical protein
MSHAPMLPLFKPAALALLVGLAAGPVFAFNPPPDLRSGSSSSSTSPVAPSTHGLVQAYRDDLRDPAFPMFLGLDEGQIIADFLELRAEIHQVVPAKAPVMGLAAIGKRAIFNDNLDEAPASQIILAHHRHFTVLQAIPHMEGATHISHAPDGTPTFYAETKDPRPFK